MYRELRALRDSSADQIRHRFPTIPRRVSGYNLDALLPENGFDVGRALVGSEGTLAVTLHAELQLVPVPRAKAMVILGLPRHRRGRRRGSARSSPRALAARGVDHVLMQLEGAAGLAGDVRSQLPSGGGWMMVQFAGGDQDDADARAVALCEDLESSGHPPQVRLIEDPAVEDRFIELREAGLGATAHPRGRHPTWEGFEDAAVPPERLGDYLREFRDLLGELGYDQTETALYGHFGQGCVHTRIPFELRTAEGLATFRDFLERAAALVSSYGGSLSGEHGDGQSKAELLPVMFGEEVVELFGRVKAIFDPGNRMNPGKVVDPAPLSSNLRLGTDYGARRTAHLVLLPARRSQLQYGDPALCRGRQLPLGG